MISPESSFQKAIFACGCFWGVQHLFENLSGVKNTVCGYTGGSKENPTYKEVCSHKTGHAEGVLVEYDPKVVSYEDLCKFFFEIHNPGQTDGQGPDIGPQYRSEIFYFNDDQKDIAHHVIELLKSKGHEVHTKVTPASTFWNAEDYHQFYYDKTGKTPYCHRRVKKF
ncbi:putative peptide methionine sulfoxide reductase, putative [Trichomonas vaginalis G3]|uniref:peptide-methionine (S)-S-oxide reductase n=1 Tax=Trichomonas vaginalis (strain ATCC PRA-98 / G3) TaxID=412133 RepID=A2FJ79_TRIV3|nr:peptide-methionine (S)-S-oxide reductase protein [Trichomonas vaginalis G3]EAX95040.1 putative peptide methionine sulfoxide reductase, putative [Trichomonas vaginalis G3]KAI5537442.1 peptide-methionine (S)-S-oxide reductase protein [Trichomonas vaginalis G3]|eukprot:XP_001307970.1 possible peptide methionine sulfoxide reductase [Trichomonas vaginalis G3]